MPVDSLMEISTRACIKISKRITDIGGMPYELARPFLLKIENPEQLHQLEQNCEQIIGHNAEIWLQLIRRDVPNWETKRHEPKNPRNWYRVYNKLKKESLEEMDAGADKLKAALDGIKAEKEQTLSQVVTHKKLPKSAAPSWHQRATHNYISGRTGSKGASKMSLLEKIKKEARDGRNARMAVPTHELRKSSVAIPPKQFVEDLRSLSANQLQSQQSKVTSGSSQRLIRTPHATTGTRNSVPPRLQSGLTQQEIQDREARLRALTSGKQSPVRIEPHEFEGSSEATEEPKSGARSMPALTARHLEEENPRRAISRGIEQQRSPRRTASPQPARVRKRKEPPHMFMMREPKKKEPDLGRSAVR